MKSNEPNFPLQQDPSFRARSYQLSQHEIQQHLAVKPRTLTHPLFNMQRMFGNNYIQRTLSDTSHDETGVVPEIAEVIQRSHRSGQALESNVHGQMESAFGAEFSGVRVHADTEADILNRTLNARAFTVGEDIFFRRGEYNPYSSAGRELLTHELTHVVQQSGAMQMQPRISEPGEEDERQADQFARQLTQTPHIGPLRVKKGFNQIQGRYIQRQKDVINEKLGAFEAAIADLGNKLALPHTIRSHRDRIQVLRKELTAATVSTRREELLREITVHETELAKALEMNIDWLREKLIYLNNPLWPPLDPQIQKLRIWLAESELNANEAELKILKRIFKPETAGAFAEKYKKEVRPLPGGGCMTAVYKGLESLYSPKESTAIKREVWKDSQEILKKTRRDTNSVDRIMETLRKHGKAGDSKTLKYSQRKNAWVPGLEETVLKMVSPEYPGWYFFGLSVSGAYHSVILAVDNSQGGPPQIYWMDQFSKGFTKNVTGKLDAELKDWKPSYGYADTQVWPLLPTPDTVIEVP